MDYYLQLFLYGEELFFSYLFDYNYVFVFIKVGKEKVQFFLYLVIFLEDVIVDFVYKFYFFLSIIEDFKKKEMLELEVVSLVIKFVNFLIGEFRKSEIKVLLNVEEVFFFLLVGKDIVDKIFNFVYDQFIGNYEFNDIQKDDKSNIVIEMIVVLVQKVIFVFKI